MIYKYQGPCSKWINMEDEASVYTSLPSSYRSGCKHIQNQRHYQCWTFPLVPLSRTSENGPRTSKKYQIQWKLFIPRVFAYRAFYPRMAYPRFIEIIPLPKGWGVNIPRGDTTYLPASHAGPMCTAGRVGERLQHVDVHDSVYVPGPLMWTVCYPTRSTCFWCLPFLLNKEAASLSFRACSVRTSQRESQEAGVSLTMATRKKKKYSLLFRSIKVSKPCVKGLLNKRIGNHAFSAIEWLRNAGSREWSSQQWWSMARRVAHND